MGLQPDGNFVVYRSADDRFVWGTYNNADAPLGRGTQHVEVQKKSFSEQTLADSGLELMRAGGGRFRSLDKVATREDDPSLSAKALVIISNT